MVIRIVADFLSFGKWADRICCGERGAQGGSVRIPPLLGQFVNRPYAVIVYRVRLFASLRMINA